MKKSILIKFMISNENKIKFYLNKLMSPSFLVYSKLHIKVVAPIRESQYTSMHVAV